MHFKIDWVSLGFALLYLAFESFSKYKPLGGLYLEGRFNGGLFASPIWGAYIWRGLYVEGLIFGILQYFFENEEAKKELKLLLPKLCHGCFCTNFPP